AAGRPSDREDVHVRNATHDVVTGNARGRGRDPPGTTRPHEGKSIDLRDGMRLPAGQDMNINSAAVATFLKQYPSEITGFIGLLREKGVRHFQRPLVAAALPVAAMYFLVYRGTA